MIHIQHHHTSLAVGTFCGIEVPRNFVNRANSEDTLEVRGFPQRATCNVCISRFVPLARRG